MSTNFQNAIIRETHSNIRQAISSRKLQPDYSLVKKQHEAYKTAFLEMGLKIHHLGPSKKFPDAIFVEDPALIFEKSCIILRPGAFPRRGESDLLLEEVKPIFNNLFRIQNGNIEGGDILRIGSHFIVGLSDRTDKIGANSLREILEPLGATLDISKTPTGVLHFKSDCSLIDQETILATGKLIKTGVLGKNYRLIQVPKGEELGANCIRINKKLLIPKGYKKLEDLLCKNYKLEVIDVSEMEKVDAGLSCLSLRW